MPRLIYLPERCAELITQLLRGLRENLIRFRFGVEQNVPDHPSIQAWVKINADVQLLANDILRELASEFRALLFDDGFGNKNT